MNTLLLEALRVVFDRFLEATDSGANGWPKGTPWLATAKGLTRECAGKLEDLFSRQARAYTKRIATDKIKEADAPGWVAQVLSDDAIWRKELGQLMLPYITRSLESGALETAAAFEIGIDFDLADRRIQKTILDRSIPFAKEVQQTTHDAVRKALAKAADEGASLYEMRERIKALPEFSAYRAEMVARTEVISAMNSGELESYALMGAKGKRWVSAHDSRTRDAHRRADGQVRRLDERFRVGGEDINHPGDGGPANRIHCRCTMSPVFDEEVVKRERGAWSEEKAARQWQETRRERDAIKAARLAAQRTKQQAYLKQREGRHARSGTDSSRRKAS